MLSLKNTRCRCGLWQTTGFYQIVMYRFMSIDYSSIIRKNMEVLQESGFSKRNRIALLKKTVCFKEHKGFKATVQSLKKLGYNEDEIVKFPKIFSNSGRTIDHRYKVLEEGGFIIQKITLPVINRFLIVAKKTVKELKEERYIEKETDVLRNILSYTDLPQDLYPPSLSDSDPFEALQKQAMQSFLCWKLDLTKEEVQLRFKTYRLFRLKSLRLMKENYDILRQNIGMSNETVRQNAYLLYQYPADFLDILQRVSKIGITPVRDIMTNFPKLLLSNADKLLESMKIMEEMDVPPESISLQPSVMCLTPETIRERLSELHGDPNFRPYFRNPRICRFIIYYHKVKRRYKFLNEIKWRSQTLNLLAQAKPPFQSTLKLGLDISRGSDLLYFLQKELKLKRMELLKRLRQNPMWTCVKITSITATLELLRERGFTRDMICDAITIVLYPRSEVSLWLDALENDALVATEIACCRNSETGELRPELTLQLALYYLERPFNFSGNGVWEHSFSSFTVQDEPTIDLNKILEHH